MKKIGNFIICNGGIGNQMFQYAFYYSQKLINASVSFDISFFEKEKCHQGFELEKAFGITDSMKVEGNQSLINDFIYKVASKSGLCHLGKIKLERIGKYIYSIPWKNSIIYGYWQSELFFYKNRELIKELYEFKNLSEKNKKLGNEMQNEESVSIHIRRGDFLGSPKYINLSETKYYKNAIFALEKLVFNSKKFYIFSDDIEWCKNCGLFGENSVYVDWNKGSDSYQDMYLMSKCKYSIIANSTFSWWGGYLGNHKAVFRPSEVKTDWNKEKLNMYFPQNWIEVPINE